MARELRKVVVVGAGSVGTTYIYALLQTGIANKIVLVDIDGKRVEGEIMDLSHGLPFIAPVVIRGGDYSECADAHIIVVTAGAKQQPGQSRRELVQKNADIVKSICKEIRQSDSEAIMIMVTNPVDTLTQVALKHLGWPRHRVMGSGTVLDSARFRHMLSKHCEIDVHNVHATILGEHGDSELAAWSMTHIAGVPIKDYCKICARCEPEVMHKEIFERVRDSAYHIIDYKGSTYFGIGMSLVRITTAIMRNEHSVLTVSTMLQGEYGLEDICLSIPAVVGDSGIERMIAPPLTEQEMKNLHSSAETLKKAYESIQT